MNTNFQHLGVYQYYSNEKSCQTFKINTSKLLAKSCCPPPLIPVNPPIILICVKWIITSLSISNNYSYCAKSFKYWKVMIFAYDIRKLYYEHFTPAFWVQNNLFEFTNREHKFKRWFYTQKSVWNVRFKDFLNTKINLSQIWYDEFNQKAFKVKNSLHTQNAFLTLNNH